MIKNFWFGNLRSELGGNFLLFPLIVSNRNCLEKAEVVLQCLKRGHIDNSAYQSLIKVYKNEIIQAKLSISIEKNNILDFKLKYFSQNLDFFWLA